MGDYEMINDILVNLFNEIWDIEEKALITEEFKNVSVNDMHIMEAIGIKEPRNMTYVANQMDITVGTLTIAINNLVKKGYVKRVRSQEDRRVVLISLDEKGKAAHAHHMEFHHQMVEAVLHGLNGEETEALVTALGKLRGFFRRYEN